MSIMKLWTCFSARVSSILRVITATSNAVEPAPYMFSAKIIVIIVFLLVWHFLLVFERSKTNLWSSTNAEMALFQQDSAVSNSQTGTNVTCAEERNTTIIEYKVLLVAQKFSHLFIKLHNTHYKRFNDDIELIKLYKSCICPNIDLSKCILLNSRLILL